MKLSDAIRKGAEETTKYKGFLFGKSDGKLVGSCALGAAIIGMDRVDEFLGSCTTDVVDKIHPILNMHIDDLPEEFMSHEDIQSFLDHPATLRSEVFVSTIVWNLNDDFDWSRKAIAEWIGTIEDYLDNGKMTKDEKRISIEENENCLQEYTY